jgi:uncharacterized membrane protein YraQ (UPF0718 family)
MEEAFLYVQNLFIKTIGGLGTSLQHNWKILLFAILIAVGMKTYVNSDKLSQLLFRKKKISIIASVLFGAFTPLCACGTTAVIIGMLTTALPWGPVMAFLTSSPLMSPDGFVLISGVIGLKFAIALTISSIVIGLSAGFITNVIEKKSNFLKDQSRFKDKENIKGCDCSKPVKITAECGCKEPVAAKKECGCKEPVAVTAECGCEENIAVAEGCGCSKPVKPIAECGCGTQTLALDSAYGDMENENSCACGSTNKRKNTKTHQSKLLEKLKLKEFLYEFFNLGIKQILLFYSIFICIGFLINYFVPSSIISLLFGQNAFYAVPLASMIGLPLYITTDSGIPIIHSMIQSGASEGAMLAFMITGSATSAWVIAGLTTFMKKRAIALYVAFVVVGGIISGYLFALVNFFK